MLRILAVGMTPFLIIGVDNKDYADTIRVLYNAFVK